MSYRMHKKIVVSKLSKTWILDLDGTLVKHNGYLIDGEDTLLDGVSDFFATLPSDDKVIILTARTTKYREITLDFLEKKSIRYDEIIFDMPHGERILFNDKKPSGLKTAIAVNVERNQFTYKDTFEVDPNI